MENARGAAVTAEGLGLKGPRGWAFRSVDLDVPAGTLVAVEGPSGSGRTCLLLALTGRMRPSEGRAEVAGLALPRRMAAVRRISALGPVPGVSDLDPALTVAEHLRERALLQRRFGGPFRALLHPRATRAEARARLDEALAAAGLDLETLPKQGRTAVRDLERLEALRLSVALALVGRPRLLAVDDTDLKLSDAERAEAWELLSGLAASGTTVLAVCSQAPEGVATVVRTTGTPAAKTPGAGGDGGPAGTGTAAPAADGPGTDTGADTGPETAPDTGTGPGDDTASAAARGPEATPATTGDAPGTDAAPATATTEQDTTEEGAADALAETGRA
ncbi:ATP-binding cassette domain-containing protein [Streptomyces zhihengii]|uniref:ATP-binding cassette domain-containing protein n=1 Tax=Streptomyces zhihengii TaxID=1818004 RepID=A0ABS2UXB1_9ACTN|nr:ATP-binding cassette domain-containing protein [Streptomyces zhihengii]MBM9622090.1 ATP-binding cassette domain-containing protein [Streptomyces zhihengii]